MNSNANPTKRPLETFPDTDKDENKKPKLASTEVKNWHLENKEIKAKDINLLCKAFLVQRNLKLTTFKNCTFIDCPLSQFNSLQFDDCKFINCTFQGKDEAAKCCKTIFNNCEFKQCKLGMHIEDSTFDNAVFSDLVVIKSFNGYRIEFNKNILKNCTFNNSDLTHTLFNECALLNVNFMQTKTEDDCYFTSCNILDCTFDHCEYSDIAFNENKIVNCKWISCIFYGIELNSEVINNEFSNCLLTEDTSSSNFEGKISNSRFNNTLFLQASFNGSLENTSFTSCVFIDLDLEDEEMLSLLKKGNNTVLANLDEPENRIRLCSIAKDKPNVVMIYMPEDGVTNTNKMLNHLLSKFPNGVNLYIVDKSCINDEIFNHPEKIDCIILGGGPDVPVTNDNDPRKQLEFKLIDTAIKYQIPTLGICRGHQVIGHYLGGKIHNVDSTESQTHNKADHEEGSDDEYPACRDVSHYSSNSTIFVRKKDSNLYKCLDDKFNKLTKQGKTSDDIINVDGKGVYSYKSSCNHSQAVFFQKDTLKKHDIKIVARKNGVIEAMEINNIQTVQHHHEDNVRKEKTGIIARAALKITIDKTKARFEKRLVEQNRKTPTI